MDHHAPIDLLSRERAAGYDPERLRHARVVVVGAGAIGANATQTLTLSGVGELRVVDFDRVEAGNLARSPLFRASDAGRSKARVAAERAARLSPHGARVRYAQARFEELGLGAFEDADVVLSAVDSAEGRARLADACRLLSVPLVESGFDGSVVHASAWPNRSADDPCYRCLDPLASSQRASCSLYAREVVAAGYLPAIQSAAAVAANLAAEAVILFLHGRAPLAEKYLELDVRTGTARRIRVARLERCPGAHDVLPPPEMANAVPVTPVRDLLARFPPVARLVLRDPFVLSAPCARCGTRVEVGLPLGRAPTPACAACPPARSEAPAPLILSHAITMNDDVARLPLSAFGFRERDMLVVELPGRRVALRLGGSASSLWREMVPRRAVTRKRRVA